MKITSTNYRKSSLKNIKISTAAGLITITTKICLDFWVCLEMGKEKEGYILTLNASLTMLMGFENSQRLFVSF